MCFTLKRTYYKLDKFSFVMCTGSFVAFQFNLGSSMYLYIIFYVEILNFSLKDTSERDSQRNFFIRISELNFLLFIMFLSCTNIAQLKYLSPFLCISLTYLNIKP